MQAITGGKGQPRERASLSCQTLSRLRPVVCGELLCIKDPRAHNKTMGEEERVTPIQTCRNGRNIYRLLKIDFRCRESVGMGQPGAHSGKRKRALACLIGVIWIFELRY